jgi:macrolide transport system ATP-binding/permease protein
VLDATLRPLRRAVAEVEALAPRLDDSASQQAYTAALEYAIAHDAWSADSRAVRAAARLGLNSVKADRRVGALSGGQRTRLALATIMTTRPDCLLLDEPTNHLDDDAIEVMTAFLRDLPGVVLLTSHDRVLLDAVCTDLVDLDPSGFGADGRVSTAQTSTAQTSTAHGARRLGGGWTAYAEYQEAGPAAPAATTGRRGRGPSAGLR